MIKAGKKTPFGTGLAANRRVIKYLEIRVRNRREKNKSILSLKPKSLLWRFLSYQRLPRSFFAPI
jgi:hypothetical protein